MNTITAAEARLKLHRLMDFAAESHEPVVITGNGTRAVLVSEDDWRGIQETLFLLSVPGMRESVREGVETSVDDCSGVPDW